MRYTSAFRSSTAGDAGIVIAGSQELGLDTATVNISGSAISIGHPIGASGARVVVTLFHGMPREQANKGLATLCIGGGQGVAMAVERVE